VCYIRKMNKLVCITGLCGSGKSVVSDYLVNKKNFEFLRFGQITLDKIKKEGLELNEVTEKRVREEFRKLYGMAAFVILNLEKLKKLLRKGNVVGDGLYSFEEYKILKENFGNKFVVIAVYAPPKLRYERISGRKMDKNDIALRNRSLSKTEAESRDFAEIENLNKGGTIAMADYTIVNTKDIKFLEKQLEEIIYEIEN